MLRLGTKIKNLIRSPLKWEQPESDPSAVSNWGWLPILSVVMAIGVWILSIAGILARSSSSGGIPLFWIALVLIFAPPAARFVSRNISRTEGVGLILILSVGTYLVNFLRSPIIFRGFDEFLHWRTAYDILQNQTLFTPNALLPISPFYPGLESATTALVNLTGLSIVAAGSIIVLTARVIMLLGLFLLYERVSGSVRTAGIGTLIYMGSSTFLYFDAQFSYESLALPLAIMALLMLFRRGIHEQKWRAGWNVLIAVTAFAVVATHHVTTYMLLTFILVWAGAELYARQKNETRNNPLDIGIWTFILAALWIATVARATISYLTPLLNSPLNSFFNILTGSSQTRKLFVDSAGRGAIPLDRILGIGSVLILLVGVAFGFWYWWLHHKNRAIPITLMLVAALYPLLPLMRLSGGSWEMSNRLSGFVYVGLGFIVALGLVKFPVPAKWERPRQWLVVAGITVAFLGGVVAGASPSTRLPQPYRAAAGEQSIDKEGTMTAEWARTILGSNNRMAADRTLTNVMGSYGDQYMIVNLNDHVSVSGIFLSYSLTPSHRMIISQTKIHYLVTDMRITTDLSSLGYYFESWEQLVYSFVPPVNPAVLEKFNYMPEVSRVYDSGDIAIYDVGGIK
jgi:hypothetical protein